jgi:hypothetical protein
MAFNINEMRSQLTAGGAKGSLFQVQITNPVTGVADIKVPFMVRATQIPESTLGTIEVPYFGRKLKLAGDRTFPQWTVTVINDEDFLVRDAMEQWSAAINSHVGNLRGLATASPSQYKAQAQVIQYSKTGVPLRTYQFNGIYPQTISSIALDWETVDAIETFEVTFDFDYWEVVGGITGTGGTNA